MQDYFQTPCTNGKSKNNLGYSLDCLPFPRFLGSWLSLLLLLNFPLLHFCITHKLASHTAAGSKTHQQHCWRHRLQQWLKQMCYGNIWMLLPKSFLGSPSDQHLCFLWIITNRKQHRTNNKNISAGNTVNSLWLVSRNSPALTQTPNGSSQSMTPPGARSLVLHSIASNDRFDWHSACRLTISMANLHRRK